MNTSPLNGENNDVIINVNELFNGASTCSDIDFNSRENIIKNPDEIKNDLIREQSTPGELSAAQLERNKFTKHSPLVTLLFFCIGPLSNLYQVTGEALDQFQVSVRFKNDKESTAMDLYGFCNIIVQVYVFIGMYFAQVCMCGIPSLIGKGDRAEAALLTSDIYRFAFLFSLVFPIAFFWVIKPLVLFEGCPSDNLANAINFVLPPTIGMVVIVFFNMTVGFFMSIGKADWAAYNRIAAYTLQTGVFTPIMLFVIRITTKWIRSSMVWAELIVTSITFSLIFIFNKFTLKPTFKLFFRKSISPKFKGALLNGLPIIFQFICISLPPTLILQSLTSTMKDDARAIAAVFGVFNRITCYIGALPNIFTNSLLSVGTHAFGSRDYHRLIAYFLWTVFLSTLVILILVAIMILKPRMVANIFLHSDKELNIAEIVLPIPFYTVWLQPFTICCNNILIITGHPMLALLASGIQAVSLSAGCKVFLHFFKDKPFNIMYVYNFTDILLLVSCLLLIIQPARKVISEMRKDDREKLFYTAGVQ